MEATVDETKNQVKNMAVFRRIMCTCPEIRGHKLINYYCTLSEKF